MSRHSSFERFFFLVLVVGVLAIGFMVPTFYDWSGVDQSHSTPEADRSWYIVLGFVLLTWLALPWIPGLMRMKLGKEPKSETENGLRRFQFNLRTLLIIMTVVAVSIIGLGSYRLDFVLLLVCTSLVFSMWIVAHRLLWNWQVASLFACMYFPWAWAFVHKAFRKDFDWTMLFAAIGLPGFMPGLFVGRMVLDQRVEDSPWIMILMTVIMLAIGVWMIRLGPRRTVAWLVFVLFVSLIGSFGLNAGIRI